MKKATNKLYIVLGMLAMMLFMAITPTKAYAAETVTDGDWEYTISSGSATISKYNGNASVVTIPSKVTIDGVSYTIRTIGGSAFENNATMTKLTIPETITSLGNKAFKNCTALTEIIIKGDIADCHSRSAESYYYDGYSVFMNAGMNGDGITVIFAEGVTRVPNYLFATGYIESGSQKPAYVTKVVIADTVTEIGVAAFYNCANLTDIQFGSGVTTIGEAAFRFCKGLQELTIGSKVQTIGKNAFENCTKLSEIQFSNSVTTIGQSAFEECTSLKSATLPTKTNTIGAYAFWGCTSLETLVLPEVACSVGNNAFKNCTALESVTVKGNIADCHDRSSETYYYADYSVFMNAGSNGDGITVTFAEGVTRVPNNLFATGYIESGSQTPAYVTKVIFADTVTEIGYASFYNCTKLTDIQFGSGVTTISQAAFRYCTGLQKLTIGNNVQTIGKNAFKNCTKLSEVKFSNSVTTIGQSAFESCTSLKSATLPTKANTIGAYAFWGCTSLETVVLPEVACSLGSNAFKNCTALKSVTVKADIADCHGRSAETYYYSDYSVFMNAGQNADELVVTFTDGVTRVPAYLFATGYIDGGSQTPAYITKVVLSDTITDIGAYAFYNCTELERVEFGVGIKTIGKEAFAHDSALSTTCMGKNREVLLSADVNGSMYPEYKITSISIELGDLKYVLTKKGTTETQEVIIPNSMYTATINNPGVLKLSQDRYNVFAGMVAEPSGTTVLQYRWTAHNKSLGTTEVIQDWTESNEWLSWNPTSYGEYELIPEARLKYNPDSTATVTSDPFEFNPYIKGKCQMPYWGEGGGYLIGVESYENPNQSYQYEMLIYDCTYGTWVYTTNKFTVTEGAAGWCVWQPQYGYYWTLFRVYDAAGNMIDQACYPFVNAY